MTDMTIQSFDRRDHKVEATTLSQPTFFERIITNWLSQGAIARLTWLDDQLLHDAGITRHDIEWARRLPITVNAEKALMDRVASR
jgi:uncharacterized protein YjiS (DUF1127 family)